MKKTITLLALFCNVYFCISPVMSQCPSSYTSDNGPYSSGEDLMGQVITNSCTFSMTGLTVRTDATTTGTITLNIYSGNNSCNGGTLLKSGSISGGQTGDFTISLSSPQSLSANTNYYLELAGNMSGTIVSHENGTYPNGFLYFSRSTIGQNCITTSDDLRFAIVGSVLPVELTKFNVQSNEGGKKHLMWETASETQNKGFDIERSTDGVRFEKIGSVAGKGTTTTTQSYTFEDNTYQKGVSYYRLKQIDFDGHFEYSKVVAVTQNGKNKVSAFPNPSNGIFTITGLEDIEDKTFVLMNSVGQPVSIKVQNNGQVDMSAYPLGLYYLHIVSASSGQVMKLLKE